MMKKLCSIALSLSFVAAAMAQDSLYHFRNDIKISLLPIFSHAGIVTYERALPHRQSVEAELCMNLTDYDFGRYNSPSYFGPVTKHHFAALQVGYKYMLFVDHDRFNPDTKPVGYYHVPFFLRNRLFRPEDYPAIDSAMLIGVQRDWMVEDGYLVSGCYVKARLNYTYIWRTYDCFVRNEGPNIITESRTFHENDLNLAFIFGYQYVGRRGFVFDIFGGGNIPLVYAGRFHTRENPGYCHTHWAWFTGGIRLGWAF